MCSGSLTGTGKLRFYNWKAVGQHWVIHRIGGFYGEK